MVYDIEQNKLGLGLARLDFNLIPLNHPQLAPEELSYVKILFYRIML